MSAIPTTHSQPAARTAPSSPYSPALPARSGLAAGLVVMLLGVFAPAAPADDAVAKPAPNPRAAFFALSVDGTLAHGATVQMRLRKPNQVGLEVQWVTRAGGAPQYLPVGVVMFGQVASGSHSLHWNLRVNGQRLTSTVYFITMHNFAGGLGGLSAAPGGEYLTITTNGHIKVSRHL